MLHRVIQGNAINQLSMLMMIIYVVETKRRVIVGCETFLGTLTTSDFLINFELKFKPPLVNILNVHRDEHFL